jgi:hypothetical protein
MTISSGYRITEDELKFNGIATLAEIQATYGISATWDSATGTMNLSGQATATTYNTVIGLLQYDNNLDAGTPHNGDRVIGIVATDVAGNESTAKEVVVRVNSATATFSAPASLAAASTSHPEVTHDITDPAVAVAGDDAHYDIALLTGFDQTIHLSQLTSIEQVNLTGTGNNQLTVTLQDVLNISTNNTALQNVQQALKVVGDIGDAVNLVDTATDHWSQISQVTSAGTLYHVYHNSAAPNTLGDIWIKDQVQVNIV